MVDCSKCARRQEQTVPFAAYESIKATLERTVKRLWIAVLVLIVLLCATNALWIAYKSQFANQEAQVDVDTGEGAAYVSGIGDVNVGESENKSAAASPQNGR